MAGQRRSAERDERPMGEDGIAGSAVVWRKSSHSNHQSACVEVGDFGHDTVGLRDSKDPEGAVLTFSRSQLRSFIAAVVEGEFTGDR
jgi:hypothetical protein